MLLKTTSHSWRLYNTVRRKRSLEVNHAINAIKFCDKLGRNCEQQKKYFGALSDKFVCTEQLF